MSITHKNLLDTSARLRVAGWAVLAGVLVGLAAGFVIEFRPWLPGTGSAALAAGLAQFDVLAWTDYVKHTRAWLAGWPGLEVIYRAAWGRVLTWWPLGGAGLALAGLMVATELQKKKGN